MVTPIELHPRFWDKLVATGCPQPPCALCKRSEICILRWQGATVHAAEIVRLWSVAGGAGGFEFWVS